jgi:hypothetical protein
MKTSTHLLALVLACSAAPWSHAQEASSGRKNMLTNPSFEDGQTGWETSGKGTVTLDATEKRGGKAALRIENAVGGDTFAKQTIAVKPQTRYRLSGYIKTKNAVAKNAAATLSLAGGYEKTESIQGNKSWGKVSFEFDSGGASEIKVGPRLGHWYSEAMGTAWFDDLSLVELGPSRKR